MAKALDDLRAIEVGTGEALSLAGRFLAEMGVEVIKVEAPAGDPLRQIPPIMDKGPSYPFEMLNPNKRSVVLDLNQEEDISALKKLMGTAEIFIESFPDKPGFLSTIDLDYPAVRNRMPGLIYLSITGFGLTGPYAYRPWSDITAQAISGNMYVGGKETDPPTKSGPSVAEFNAAIYGVAGITAALYNRDLTGRGQQVEVSAADCMVPFNCTGLLHTYHSDMAGGHIGHPPFARMGLAHGTASPYNGYMTADGLWEIIATFSDAMWAGVCRAMGREDLIEDPRFATNAQRIINRDECDAVVGAWVAQHTAAEVTEMMKDSVPVGIGSTIEGVLENPQFTGRDLIKTIPSPDGEITIPNSPFRMLKTPGVVDAPAPALGEANVSEFLDRKPTEVENPIPQDRSEGPLKGLKIADFTAYVAGAWAPRLMADLGAEVVKVERPGGELFRFGPPQINGVKGAGGMFNNTNTGKKSVCINRKDPKAHELLKKFCTNADLVMENNATGSMHANGRIGYEDLVGDREDLVYLSATGFGVTGPMAHRLAYDACVQAECGVQSLGGWPGGQPHRAGDSGLDLMGPAVDVAAALAALHYRKRTGEGQYIDIGMSDTGVMLTYSAWPAYMTKKEVLTSYANTYPFYAPYNGYEASDRMVTIGVTTDEQWVSLVNVMGDAAAAVKGLYLTAAERLEHASEIDAVVAAWVSEMTAEEVERICLGANVPAGVVFTVMENIFDPRFTDRSQTVVFNHKQAGPFRAPGTPFRFSNTPVWVHGAGMEIIGEYTDKYLKEWVGVSDEELAVLKEEKVVIQGTA